MKKKFESYIRLIESLLKIWRTRYLTVKGLITVFKTFAISKIIQLTLITCILSTTVEQLNLIEKNFIWQRKQPTFKILF